MLVGNSGDFGRRDCLVLVGAGANGLGLECVFAHARGNDVNVDEALLQVGEGVLELNSDGLVILRGNGIHEGEELTEDGLVASGALVGAHDVCSLDIRAVGELGSVAQGDLVLGVGNLDGVTGSQRGADRVVGHVEAVQAFEDLPVCAHAECRGGDRAVVSGLVGGTNGDGALGCA